VSVTELKPDGHPDLAELDALRTGEATDELKGHVDGCERCRELLHALGGLAVELKRAARPPSPEIPAEIDARIRAMAHGRSRRAAYFGWPGLVAAAASVLLAAGVLWGVRARRTGLAMDIDGSGRVDIVDAYLLSRRLKSREDVPSSWDVDRDGEVGEADVSLVARRAVALAEGI